MPIRASAALARWPRRHPLAIATALALTGPTAVAATFTPTNVAQLITAINAANSNAEADTIELAGATFTLTAVDNAVKGNNGLPLISSKIVINGAGATLERSAGAASTFRLLQIAPSGDLTLSKVTLRGGVAADTVPTSPGFFNFEDQRGAGLFNRGRLTLNDSTVSGNSAEGEGGGLYDYQGTVTLNNSTVSGNSAYDSGGGLYASKSTVTLNNSTVSGNNSIDSEGGGLYLEESTVTLNDSTVSGNSAGDDAGGIYVGGYSVLTLNHSAVSGNVSPDEGGGINSNDSTVTLNHSIVSANRAAFSGGGLYSESDSTVTLINSTVSGNTASRGGGLYIDGSGDTVTLVNSTVSGNFAAEKGGGLYVDSGTVTLVNSTVSANTTASGGGGLLVYSNATVALHNSVIANSSGSSDCFVASPSNTVTALHTLIETVGNCQIAAASTNLLGQDPELGALADNGGLTLTHLPQPGSPLIDAGDNALALGADGLPLAVDQRGGGFVRIFNDRVDIGALEVQPPVQGNAIFSDDFEL